MNIYSIIGSDYDSNIFVIPGKKPTVIDTGTGMHRDSVLSQIADYINLSNISQIILTHEHFDHVGGTNQILEASDGEAKIIAHRAAAKKMEKGESIFAHLLGSSMPKISVDQQLSGDERIVIGDYEYKVISTPGHTLGCICLYSSETKTLFSGDTIFANGSFGRTDLPGGDSGQLKRSIERLSTLDITRLYPGHEMIVVKKAYKHIQWSLKNIRRFG